MGYYRVHNNQKARILCTRLLHKIAIYSSKLQMVNIFTNVKIDNAINIVNKKFIKMTSNDYLMTISKVRY
jgi:hypothetical protein